MTHGGSAQGKFQVQIVTGSGHVIEVSSMRLRPPSLFVRGQFSPSGVVISLACSLPLTLCVHAHELLVSLGQGCRGSNGSIILCVSAVGC